MWKRLYIGYACELKESTACDRRDCMRMFPQRETDRAMVGRDRVK